MKVVGKVVKGKGEGKGLGFPTANLKVTDKFKLEDGVYMAEVKYNGKVCKSITVKGVTQDLEVWLKDCQEDLYGKTLEVNVGKKISELHSSKTREELIKKIKEDIKKAKHIWETN